MIAPNPESNVVGLDELGKLGVVLGLFFFLQASGYAHGTGGSQPESVLSAVGLGAAHLSHFLLPFSKVAWPLGPIVCGALIVYAAYLPAHLRRWPEGASSMRRIAGLFLGVTITTIGGLWWTRIPCGWEPLCFRVFLARRMEPPFQVFHAGGYAALLASCSYLAYYLVGPRVDRLLRRASLQRPPGSAMLTALVVAWLLALAFIGSQFDGELDARSGALRR